jgi:hypothetical protein
MRTQNKSAENKNMPELYSDRQQQLIFGSVFVCVFAALFGDIIIRAFVK